MLECYLRQYAQGNICVAYFGRESCGQSIQIRLIILVIILLFLVAAPFRIRL